MAWLIFAVMTVLSWGVYGVLLHTGAVGMADPVHGRYKAFLFVGVAYLIVAVLGSIVMLMVGAALVAVIFGNMTVLLSNYDAQVRSGW